MFRHNDENLLPSNLKFGNMNKRKNMNFDSTYVIDNKRTRNNSVIGLLNF